MMQMSDPICPFTNNRNGLDGRYVRIKRLQGLLPLQ